MAKYINSKETLQVFLIAATSVFLLNSEGLKEWVSALPAGRTQWVASTVSDKLFAGLDFLKLTVPRREIRHAFLSFRKKEILPDSNLPSPDLSSPFAFSIPRTEPAQWRLLAGTFSSEIPVSPPARRFAHFLLFGDSMLKTAIAPVIKDALEKAFPGVMIELIARSATGLARPDVFNWESKVREELEGKSQVDNTLVFLGTNDAQNIQDGNVVHEFGSPEWNDIYRKRVVSILELVCSRSQRVYWVGAPPMRDLKFNRKIQNLNDLVKNLLKQKAELKNRFGENCVRFVSTSQWISQELGAYSSYIQRGGTSIKVRENDGIHLTLEGAGVLTQSLMRVIQE